MPTVVLSYHVKFRKKILNSGVIFTVNTYECFMENKNTVRTFCGCKSSKTTLSLIKILLFFLKKTWRLWMNSKIQNISKVKRQINFGENYRINTRLNLKTRFIWAKKSRLGFLCKWSFSMYFHRFSFIEKELRKNLQERKNWNLWWPMTVKFSTVRCPYTVVKCLVIVAKELWRWFWSGSFRMVLSKKLP